ncbi:MAG: hypothetical protein JNJ83_10970 [Verrucomicrobiaceae bacterium]|nr:hypothetical protein [Verrucomicrobiaceae bacterium]
MAAHIGILSPVITAPSGACLTRSTKKRSIEIAKLSAHDGTGATKKAAANKLITIACTLTGYGAVSLSSVTAGAITAGTVKVTAATQEESNKDFPQFTLEGVTYGSLS